MAKRFTDTDKWKREWFCELDPKAKLVWFYILDQCDHRGVWFQNFKLMSDQLKIKITPAQFRAWLGDKVRSFDGDKFFIPSFVEFQYGTLNPSNNAHKSVIELIDKLGPHEPLNSPSTSPSQGAQDKDKDKESVFNTAITKTVSHNVKEHILATVWNDHCGDLLPKVRKLGGKRSLAAEKALKEEPDIDFWILAAQKMAGSGFCHGTNDRGWVADFDFFIRHDKAVKAVEGSYSRGQTPKQTQQPRIVKD